MTQKLLTVADIFCGAGGLSAGFKNAVAWWPNNNGEKFEIAYGVDHDKDAIKTFRVFHFPQSVEQEYLETVAPCKDIKKVMAASILEAIRPQEQIDMLIGGPNCQGVSAAGLRNPDDHRNDMLLAFIQLVNDLRPKWFVMENVPGLTHANNRELLAIIFEKFEAIEGYKVSGDVLLAADYGVPQFRHRLFIIGTNTEAPIRFPLPTHAPPPRDGVSKLPGLDLPSYKTVKDAIGKYANYPPKIYDKDALPNELDIANHCCVELGEINRQRIAALKQGEDWHDMPIQLLPERYFATRASDQKGAYGRLRWDWPAYTITNAAYNVTSGPFTHPDHDRAISVREAAELQSFSEDHLFYGDILSQYRQVGNAVPPKLAQTVAEAILYCHYQEKQALNWGKEGRINLKLIRNSIEGKEPFPTLTPRFVDPLFDRRQKRKALKFFHFEEKSVPQGSAWNTEPRPPDSRPEDTRRLRKLAEQPGNYRAAKRARAIVEFIDAKPKDQILKSANVAEASVKKWVDGYFAYGLEGWRAYHTPLTRMAGNNSGLIEDIKNAITKVRQVNLTLTDNGAGTHTQPKRLYMNEYILTLIECFGDWSVDELITKVEDKLENGVGTVYVGDLLAICDVVLERGDKLKENK